MQRDCFLCKNQVELIYDVNWYVPGLPEQRLGVSICPQCGSVSQCPSATPEDMTRYYESIVCYTNPGRQAEPSSTKVRDVEEQVQFAKRAMCRLPDSVLQIGSSDGYTLSKFKEAGVRRVLGVEPGAQSVQLAKEKYGIDSFQGMIEDFRTSEPFELILMTHVLEHFFNPSDVLERCYSLQAELEEGFILVEVPLLCDSSQLCPGFFSFEHLNYYTRSNLTKSLLEAGYVTLAVVEHYNSDASPVLGVLASTNSSRRLMERQASVTSDYEENKAIVNAFREREVKTWNDCLARIKPQLDSAERLFFWGAGIHTSQLLADTDFLKHYTLHALLDSSSLKWGLKQGEWECLNPQKVDWKAGDCVLISSYMSEKEIFDSLAWLREMGVKTLRFHHVDDTKSM